MRAGDPSFLQTSASSGLSEIGMTGIWEKIEGKKRRAAAAFRLNGESTIAARRFFPSVSQLDTCHPDCREGSPTLFLQLT